MAGRGECSANLLENGQILKINIFNIFLKNYVFEKLFQVLLLFSLVMLVAKKLYFTLM